MIRLGLTGSIGMGKSATAQMFRLRGVPVYDADAAVHEAYAAGGEAVAPVEWAFPGVMTPDGAIDRNLLRARVLNDAEAMAKLEGIIHPIIAKMQREFMDRVHAARADVLVLDIPLLFEKGGAGRVDAVAVVSAPFPVQRQRVLARPGMTEEVFAAILARQTPNSVKRRRADFVINTGLGFTYAQAQVDLVLRALREGRSAAAKTADAPGEESRCEKSVLIPKPLDWTPKPATALSK